MRGRPNSWIDELSAEAIVCRDLHHAWNPFTAAQVPGGFVRELKCRTCGSIKKQKLNSVGFIVSSSYVYSEGYLRKPGLGRITAQENALLRLTHLKESM